MTKRDHPCAKDCPDRSAECRLTCTAWKEYVEKRNIDYDEEHKMRLAEAVAYSVSMLRAERVRKYAKRWRKHNGKS